MRRRRPYLSYCTTGKVCIVKGNCIERAMRFKLYSGVVIVQYSLSNKDSCECSTNCDNQNAETFVQ